MNTRTKRQQIKTRGELEVLKKVDKNTIDNQNQICISKHPSKNHIQKQRSFGTEIINGVLQSRINQNISNINQPQSQINTMAQLVQPQFMIIQEMEQLKPRKSEVAVYESIISDYLQSAEKLVKPIPDYLLYQSQIDERMRDVLFRWLIELHERLRLKQETLFKAATIIDQSLSLIEVKKDKLQLLGITALYISCKYEEIMVPNVHKFASFCGNVYSVQNIMQMQSQILISMNFNLVTISPLRLMQLKCQTLSLSEDLNLLSEYILQLCLLEYKMCKYSSSLMSVSSLYLSGKLLQSKQLTGKGLLKMFGLQQSIFKDCLKDMFQTYKGRASQKCVYLNLKYQKKGVI